MTQKSGKDMKTYERISVVVAILSLLLNIFLAFAVKLKQQQLQLAEMQPHILTERIIFSGDGLKAFKSISQDVLGNTDRAVLVATDMGQKLYQMIDETEATRKLEAVEAEFLVIQNCGKMPAENVKLISGKGEEELALGNVSSGSRILVPLSYTVKQPWKKEEETAYSRLTFEYEIAGKLKSKQVAINSETEKMWIPCMDKLRGVGKALVGETNKHLFKHLDSEK